MYLRRSAVVKYFIAAFLGAALYSEWVVYLMQPLYWPELKCKEEICTKILFIADPQIQGELAVPPPLNYLFIWDSDQYLRSTFSTVIKHFKPDVLVYLGDLMDEGSIATMPQFHKYAKRLFSIFELDYSVVQVWLPGDNDIGGENEPIKAEKVKEFDSVFEQPPVISYKNIAFYKVNAITKKFPKLEDNSTDICKVVVSHYPVTLRQAFGNQVNNEIRPNIYFSAHDHESKYVKQDDHLTHRETHWLTSAGEIVDVPTNRDPLYEIYVPTCSYRMGTPRIGFGAAVFENNNADVRYTVFWSPQRFPYLFFYLFLLIIAVLYCLVFCAAKIFVRCKQPTTPLRSSDKVPLLDRV